MLAFETPYDHELMLSSMRTLDNHNDYLQQVLLPALMRGDWDQLNEMIIYQDEKKSIRFGDDVWEFGGSNYKAKSVGNLYFTVGEEMYENVVIIHPKDRLLIDQIKCIALADIWFSTKQIGLISIKSKINILRNDIAQISKHGVTSFEQLTLEQLEILVEEGCFDLTKKTVFKGLNALPALSGLLPFSVNFPRLRHKFFNARPEQEDGKIVIPPRIYFSALNAYSDAISTAYMLRDEIEKSTEDMLVFLEFELERKLKKIRKGISYKPGKTYQKSWLRFTKALDDAGVRLVDYGEDPLWMEVFQEHKTVIELPRKRLDKYAVMLNGVKYSLAGFKRYLSELNAQAAWLCLALTGMRIDELFLISPVYGAQKKTFDRDGFESESGKETIYFLTTRQSKITLNSQTKNDTYVTVESGWKAFYVLNAIHSPYRKRFTENVNHRMFASVSNNQLFQPVTKAALGKSIKTKFNQDSCFELTLSVEDMGYLQASDPMQKLFKPGDKFHFTCHQTRRSFAYYLIGYELCSFPALKQQLSHLSLAMTRWYARNAHSFEALYSEINKERTLQKAEILARMYQKIANGERIAGGKGQAVLSEISRVGENYFEDGINSRKLSTDYWIEQLTNNKTHLHAVAPGMYCTNTQCSMRINIDLSECVDCEYDYIENALYAESSRLDAMRNLELLKECGELNSSAASKFFMQIKAAEEIMNDLGFKYQKYKFDDDVMSLVISTRFVG